MTSRKQKGDFGEAMVFAAVVKLGYKVAVPWGEDWRYDLIVLRNDKLERVQCKYVESDGKRIEVPCKSSYRGTTVVYTSDNIDWIAVYDRTSDACYFLPASMLGTGRRSITLRLTPPKNGQTKSILMAKDFVDW